MKSSEQGPFDRIRWFCSDGTVLPPKAYACSQHGGGHQHGELSKHSQSLRSNGYWIANLLAGIDAKKTVGGDDFQDHYNQLLIEKFLITIDDGWIMRKAQFYRGAIQEEDEREGARELLITMLAQPEWTGLRFPALRIGARLLPHGQDNASVQKVRQMAASLADSDKGFKPLRVKIHGSPDAGDAATVREYAGKINNKEKQSKYLQLADEIDQVYQADPLADLLEQNAAVFSGGPWLQKILRDAANAYEAENTAANHYRVTGKLLADLRRSLTRVKSPSARLRVMDLSFAVEAANFRASTELRDILSQANRA
ncbi:MAG: phosphoenolpyruvate synthase, partial [Gammaproteobacteria bacterium]|nr:phosphoenolpyruvate synthase [Gammaproteobacteria bacterium]MDX2487242.1 phosphoenolpyruvate synthase [Gammaproteobacteria bacterium]